MKKMDKRAYQHEDLTERIIGCAFNVYNKMGAGFLESVYERALEIELRKAGLRPLRQQPVDVYYDRQLVGQFKADIVVDNLVILELKAVENLVEVHEVQLVNYLRATGLPVGLLINFGPRKVEIKRRAHTLPPLPPSDPSSS